MVGLGGWLGGHGHGHFVSGMFRRENPHNAGWALDLPFTVVLQNISYRVKAPTPGRVVNLGGRYVLTLSLFCVFLLVCLK